MYGKICEYTNIWAFCMYGMHERISLLCCVCVPVSWCHSATVPGSPAVWRGGCALCVCLCAWSRCAEPPCAACCPSVLPSVCRLRPRFANSTAPQQEDPGERDVERWRESEAKGGSRKSVTGERRCGRCACYWSHCYIQALNYYYYYFTIGRRRFGFKIIPTQRSIFSDHLHLRKRKISLFKCCG